MSAIIRMGALEKEQNTVEDANKHLILWGSHVKGGVQRGVSSRSQWKRARRAKERASDLWKKCMPVQAPLMPRQGGGGRVKRGLDLRRVLQHKITKSFLSLRKV